MEMAWFLPPREVSIEVDYEIECIDCDKNYILIGSVQQNNMIPDH